MHSQLSFGLMNLHSTSANTIQFGHFTSILLRQWIIDLQIKHLVTNIKINKNISQKFIAVEYTNFIRMKKIFN